MIAHASFKKEKNREHSNMGVSQSTHNLSAMQNE